MDLSRLTFAYGVYFPVVFARGEPVGRHLENLAQTQWIPLKDLKALQHRKLAALLDVARDNVPFYRNRIMSREQALETLPFLLKSDIQASRESLLHPAWRGACSVKTTGGSTGQAVTIRKSRDATARESAANWRGFGWAGVGIGDKQARFWGTPFAWRDRFRVRATDFLAHRRRCSAFAFTEADLARYTVMLDRFKPKYFYGYVSMLDRYAEYVCENNVRLSFRPTAIITTSEVLTSASRNRLEQTFGCRVFNEFGCGELGTIAHECEKGRLHINAENLFVEIVTGDRPAEPGEVGEIVVTELNNHAMPLIRYRLGDFGALSAMPCECGRALPVLDSVFGRGYDLVYNREGKMFHGEYFMYMFEEVKRRALGITSFQVVQESYEKFTIRVVPGDGYSEATRRLVRARFHDGYGPEAEVSFDEVSEIPRRPSGKMQLIVGLSARGAQS